MAYARLQHFFIDKNSAALTADEVSVRNQLLVTGHNRVSCDVELLCKLPAGGQFHTRRKRPVQNTVHELLPNLVLQIHGLLRVYVDDGVLHLLSLVGCSAKLPQIPQNTNLPMRNEE